jgi:hypothetical protein
VSTSAAIAAVTQTLASLLEATLQVEDASYKVSTLPLDRSNANTQEPNRLNLYLFQVFHNAAWRNTDLPDRTRPGETGRPPLALNLSYMLTAYGETGPEGRDHRVLGLAMQFLHDHPLLLPDDIRRVFPGTGLDEQIELARITPRTLSLEEMVRMWGTFMTQYRVSAAYDVSVVLIDSLVAAPAAAPVLRRGEDDRGAVAESSLPPLLTRALPPELLRRGMQVTWQPAVRVGETLTIEGDRLTLDETLLQVRHPAWEPRWAGLGPLAAGPRAGTLQVALTDPPPEPDRPAASPAALAWAPGVYTAALLLRRAGRADVVSNAVPFALAPRVQISPTNVAAGDLALTVSVFPGPRVSQHVTLLVSGRDPIPFSGPVPAPVAGQPSTFAFTVPALSPGEYLVRLRVDGVDSLPYVVSRPAGQPPRLDFDPTQKVVVA